MNAKKAELSWCFYDFANSAFATTILTFVFPVYFKSVLVGEGNSVSFFGSEWTGTAFYPLLLSLSLLAVLMASPFLGRWADKNNKRKFLLMIFCTIGAVSTSLLYFTDSGQWKLGALLFSIANIGFAGGNVYYNSLIKEIASEKDIARVSAKGWGLGYLGGFLALVAQLLIIQMPDLVGVDKLTATKLAFLTTGIWWFVWAIPLFVGVEEGKGSKQTEQVNIEWKSVFTNIFGNKVLLFFLIAFFLYNEAVQTVISQAANVAGELLNMKLEEVLQAGVMIQFVAIFGSWLFLAVEKRVGTHKALMLALVNWIFIMIAAMIMQEKWHFLVISAWVGLVMGVTQSASRTLFGRKVPREQSSTFFAFYAIGEKASNTMGPFVFALSAHILPLRLAMLPLLGMLLGGLYFLHRSDSHGES